MGLQQAQLNFSDQLLWGCSGAESVESREVPFGQLNWNFVLCLFSGNWLTR